LYEFRHTSKDAIVGNDYDIHIANACSVALIGQIANPRRLIAARRAPGLGRVDAVPLPVANVVGAFLTVIGSLGSRCGKRIGRTVPGKARARFRHVAYINRGTADRTLFLIVGIAMSLAVA
jgi:hypothetical protein